nr:TniQ family protein [Rhodoferax sp.]
MINQRFFGIPLPEEVEAPSSWFPRAASSQGASLREFTKMLGFSDQVDIDQQFIAMAPRHIAQVCGLPAHSFDFVHRMLEQARDLKMSHSVLLTHRKRPRYRYCPMCLKTQRTPYFPVHWRFDVWRMCYHHMCMMEDKCGHCHRVVVLTCPQSPYQSIFQKPEVCKLT